MSHSPLNQLDCEKFRRWAEEDWSRLLEERPYDRNLRTHSACIERDLRWFATVADMRTRAKVAEEEAKALRLRVAELEVAQGELLEQLDHSVYVSERPDYCRVCDRYFPW